MTTLTRERRTAGLFLAIFSSELLLVLSFLRLLGDTNSAVFHTIVMDSVLSQSIWGTALARNIAAFVGALLFIHLLLGVAAWTMAQLSRLAWPRSPNSLRVWTLLWLVLFVIWILSANAAWFPSSSLGSPYASLPHARFMGVSVFQVVTIALAAYMGLTLLCALRRYSVSPGGALWTTGAATLVAGIAAISSVSASGTPDRSAAASSKPHVILIGLDSLRPDALHAEDGRDMAPSINRFLSGSTVFPDTITPLARTFPSWVSIISGKHPHTTGALNNLLTRDLIDESDTLPKMLNEAGYHTVYATDEVRFSNLDLSYGFQEMIAPPMGATDFLLGFFSDTPLANLVINTRAGELLFPYAYANRAAAVTYEPDTFIERLDGALRFDTPTLLAVHLTLAHWPYTWASLPRERRTDALVTARQYRHAVTRVDEQFDALMNVLDAHGALDNAIVVVLSDHGESLGEPSPMVEDKNAARHTQGLKAAFGHGTSVFAEPQYQVLLAMRSFGTTPLPTKAGAMVHAPASLEDITPTLADSLSLPHKETFDGVSWLSTLQGRDSRSATQRIRFTETEFVPPGFASGTVFSTSMLNGAVAYYRVDAETDRVLIRGERLDDILESRQYAAIRGGSVLAAVPSDDKQRQHVVYIKRPGTRATWLTEEPGPESGDVFGLWRSLEDRFESVRARPVIAPLGEVN